MGFLTDIRVARIAGSSRDWELIAPLIYEGNTHTFTAPRGFRTDFASVPRILQILVPKNGVHDAPAIMHDYLYRIQPIGVTRSDADKLFLRMMREVGVNYIRRTAMFFAVRTCGWYPWRKCRVK